jgi:polysaccharide biosynthesis/export protein
MYQTSSKVSIVSSDPLCSLPRREARIYGRFIAIVGLASMVSAGAGSDLNAQTATAAKVKTNVTEAAGQLVTVEGSVNKPGQYPVVGRMTLTRLVAIAGGTTDFASLREAIVFRTVGGQRQVARFNIKDIRAARADDPEILGNDLVVIGDSAGRKMFKDVLTVAPMAGIFYPVGK